MGLTIWKEGCIVNETNDKAIDLRETLGRMIDERPARKKPWGRLVLHFDAGGNLRRIDDGVSCKQKHRRMAE
jgi:hypothetical protein